MEEAAVEKQDKVGREAAVLLKRIEADPTAPELYVQLAAAYRRQGNLDRARATLLQGQGPTGNSYKLQLELLELDILPLRGNLDKAEAQLRKVQSRAEGDDTVADPAALEGQHRLRLDAGVARVGIPR